jgi:hypothetical protein
MSQASNLVPTLRQVVETAGLDPNRLSVAVVRNANGPVRITDRHSIPLAQEDRVATWGAPSLQELFRGGDAPPADIDQYPEEYAPYFMHIEGHLLALSDGLGDRTDQEMEEVYSSFRRRPDGRSLGHTHGFIWQAAALLLATRVLSEAQFTGIFSALEKSTRKWALRPVSRFYLAYLRQTFG